MEMEIIKGKRTKRPRPSSSFDTDHFIKICTSSESLMTSSETSREEDEDMANCLILLAQSVCVSPIKEEKFSDESRHQRTEKLTSKKLTEVISINVNNGKSGYYVYECKTCNRSFPSFQALGGHRASHKKPKVNLEDKKPSSSNIQQVSIQSYYEKDDQDKVEVIDDDHSDNIQKSPSSSPLRIGVTINSNNKAKVHECSICGSEFLSGQALGGHMRKHRPVQPVNNTMNIDDHISGEDVSQKSQVGILSLDLNLPPPEMVDEVIQSRFQFTAGSSQQRMVFSSPALVDCHY